jgi:hypothetical protein
MEFLKNAFKNMTRNTGENAKMGEGLAEINHSSDQPNDEQALCSFVKGKLEEVRQSGSRTAQEGNWMTNYSYMLGFAGVVYDTTLKQYRVTLQGGGLKRNRVNVNKILPTVQRRQARLCKNRPKYEVRPDASTEQAREQARLEQNLIEFYYDKEHLDEKRLRMTVGLQQCGHYFMGVNWDTEKGRLMGKDEQEENGEVKKAFEYEGDVSIDIISPFEMFVDPLATEIENAQWLVRAKVRKLDYFQVNFERGHLVKEEGAWLLSAQNEMRIQSLVGQGPSQTGTQQQEKNSALEIAYYEKRSKKHPNGRLIIVANGILLHDGELPVGEFPFVKFDDIQIAGKFYSEAIVTHLRPIQDQFNRLLSKRTDWINKLVAGKYIAARGHAISQEAFTDQSGEILYYDPVPNASEPHAMQIPMIPQYAYAEEDKLNNMFYDIAGDSDISRGILPAAGIPAIGMQLLLEQDETRIGATTEQHEHSLARLGKLLLMYLEKFAKTKRLMKIADPNSVYDVTEWDGSKLKSDHDVIVSRGSLAPASRATHRNDIMNLYTSGLLGDPNDPSVKSKVLSMLEFGEISAVWSERALDEAQIRRTIKQIESEEIPEVYESDNHVLHYQKKNEFRKSEKFDTLTDTSKSILLANMEEHLHYLMKLTSPQFGLPVDDSEGANLMATESEGQSETEAALNDRLNDRMNAEGLTLPEPNAGIPEQGGQV